MLKQLLKYQVKAKRYKKNYPSYVKLNAANYSAKKTTKIQQKTAKQTYFKLMALSRRQHAIMKVVQPTHEQDDIRYGTSRGIHSSGMSLISVSWTLH